MRAFIILLGLSAVSVAQLSAEVAPQPLETVVWESELIVLARVTSVSPHAPDKKSYATAQVVETWKGTPGKKVEFLTEPWWACDMSEAHTGETVVLFLIRGEQSRSYLLNAAGGGRMPLRSVRGKRYATVSGAVILPSETPTIDSPASDPYSRSVDLDTLRKLVAVTIRALSTPKA